MLATCAIVATVASCMPADYFHLVPQVVEATKYFEISRPEIERELEETGEIAIDGELILEDDGEETTIPLDVRIAWKNGVRGWSLALLLHGIRIDGIDMESSYLDKDSERRSGWHRHVWNPSTKEAEKFKEPINDLDDVATIEEFLIRSFQVMNISLNRLDHGNYELQFD